MDVASTNMVDEPMFVSELSCNVLSRKDDLVDDKCSVDENEDKKDRTQTQKEQDKYVMTVCDLAMPFDSSSLSKESEDREQSLPIEVGSDEGMEGKGFDCIFREQSVTVEDQECQNVEHSPSYCSVLCPLDYNDDKTSKEANELGDLDISPKIAQSDHGNAKATSPFAREQVILQTEKGEFGDGGTKNGSCSDSMQVKEEDCLPMMLQSGTYDMMKDNLILLSSPEIREKSQPQSPEGECYISYENSPQIEASEMQQELSSGNSNENLGTSDSREMVTDSQALIFSSEIHENRSSQSPQRESLVQVRYSQTKTSVAQQKIYPRNIDAKPAHLVMHTLSPQNRMISMKKDSSYDRFAIRCRDKSPVEWKQTNEGNSPSKHLFVAPRRQETERKRKRSVSLSPLRRKDFSEHKVAHRGRSRSRSPYVRDRYRRSPRRTNAPNYKSPSSNYHSRHYSPRRSQFPPADRRTRIGRPGKNLFVAGFSFATTERDLQKKFSRFGDVKDVRIVRCRRSGDSRGFGFLSLERDEDADAAIRALDQTEWNGRIILVEKSKICSRNS